MTRAEWLRCSDPRTMLPWILGIGTAFRGQAWLIASDRERRLLACAFARMNALDDPRSIRAVEVAELYADGGASDEALESAHREAGFDAFTEVPRLWERDACVRWAACDAAKPDATDAARRAQCYAAASDRAEASDAWRKRLAVQACIVRELFGDPFVDQVATTVDGTAARIARNVYDSRDFASLPILADALEDGGCGDHKLLHHLRGEEPCPSCLGIVSDVWFTACSVCDSHKWVPLRGPHALGCWALDAALGYT